jgi:hypothetical protein
MEAVAISYRKIACSACCSLSICHLTRFQSHELKCQWKPLLAFKLRPKEHQWPANILVVSDELFLVKSFFVRLIFTLIYFWFFLFDIFLNSFFLVSSKTRFYVNFLAELRTISLSDLSVKNYNAIHRKLSETTSRYSPAVSYYSGTESQQSISDRSFYDNVEYETEIRDKIQTTFLMPPMARSKNSLVNRSRSFQETTTTRPNLSLRRNLQDSNSIDDRLGSNRSSPIGSTVSDSSVIQNRKLVQLSSDNSKHVGPFYVKIFRRVRKFSTHWRKCKKVSRGSSPKWTKNYSKN